MKNLDTFVISVRFDIFFQYIMEVALFYFTINSVLHI